MKVNHFSLRALTVISLIFLLGFFVRTYRLTSDNFGSDQARDFDRSLTYVENRKITLVGPETVLGTKTFWFGPFHYWFLELSQLATNHSPVQIYYFWAIVYSLSPVVLYLLTKRLSVSLLFAVFPLAVLSGRFPWNPNHIALFSTLAAIFGFKKKYFLAGLVSAVCVQSHFTAALFVIGLFLWLLYRNHHDRLKLTATFLGGLGIGLSPLFLSEIKRGLPSVHSLIGFSLNDSKSRGFSWHYFLWLTPLLVLPPVFTSKKRVVLPLTLIVFASFILFSQYFFKKPIPTSLHFVDKVATQILKTETALGENLPYNIASITDSDARALPARYALRVRGAKVLGPEEYTVADHLYVIVPHKVSDKTILSASTYEVSVFKPVVVSSRWAIGDKDLVRLDYH